MEVVRAINLEDQHGTPIMQLENDPMGLKDAIFYIEEKTKGMSDEDFMSFLKGKTINGPFTVAEKHELMSDRIMTYPFLQKYSPEELLASCDVILNYLVKENKVS